MFRIRQKKTGAGSPMHHSIGSLGMITTTAHNSINTSNRSTISTYNMVECSSDLKSNIRRDPSAPTVPKTFLPQAKAISYTSLSWAISCVFGSLAFTSQIVQVVSMEQVPMCMCAVGYLVYCIDSSGVRVCVRESEEWHTYFNILLISLLFQYPPPSRKRYSQGLVRATSA